MLPPPLASKKLVFIVRSNNNIVIPQANTGRLTINKKVVTIIVHNINTRLSNLNLPLPFRIVVIKLNLATILEIPAIWSLKILKSTDIPAWPSLDLSGG